MPTADLYAILTFNVRNCILKVQNTRIRKDDIYYELDGNRILSQTGPSGVICYYYDTEGVCGFNFNGNQYFYQKNLQGDITAIYDHNGNLKAEYVYDAWGNHTIEVNIDGIATLNPFRYRGYYYDTETGLYYINSRYYDPVTCRFISPDATDTLTATPMELTDKNLYAYCDNNPVTRADYGGEFWNTIIGGLAGAVVGGITAAIAGTDITAGIVSGAISGAVSGAAVDIAIAATVATGGVGLAALVGVAIASGAGGAAGSYVNQRMNGVEHENVDWETVIIDGIWGAVGGMLSFGTADVGGKMCRTLAENLALRGKAFFIQAGSDFVMAATISAGTWLNGTKMQLIREGKAFPSLLIERFTNEKISWSIDKYLRSNCCTIVGFRVACLVCFCCII